MTRTRTVFITGANRGLGLGMAQAFLKSGLQVIATARNIDGARELWELERDYGKRLKLVALDVTDEASIKKAAQDLASETIDILVNNAGFFTERDKDFATLTADALIKTFTINAVGPILVTQAFLPHLKAAEAPIVATLSSKMGSIADNNSGGAYAYRMSKAAANMFNKSLALEHKFLTATVLHPGWVQTDMGGKGAPLSVDDSVEGLVKTIMALKKTNTGKFYDYTGEELPW